MSSNPNSGPAINALRIESAPLRAKQYMDSILVDTAIREIMDPLKLMYVAKGAAQSYIDSFEIVKLGFLQINLENNHRIAQWLEYGTEPHKIGPSQNKKSLSWSGPEGQQFAYTVQHPGFGGYRVIPYQLAGLINRFIIVLVNRTNEFLERSKV